MDRRSRTHRLELGNVRCGDPDAQAYMWGMASQLSDEMIEAISTLESVGP